MTLLHATWLNNSNELSHSPSPVLFLWADTWRVPTPIQANDEPSLHPFTLSSQELQNWLRKKELLPQEIVTATASLTLPSKPIPAKIKNNTASRSYKLEKQSQQHMNGGHGK